MTWTISAKRLLRATLAESLTTTGLLSVLQSRAARHPTILYYHRVANELPAPDLGLTVTADNFNAQMQWLASHYDVRPLGNLLDDWAAGIVRTSPQVAVTFDDGYRDNYDVAFPILARHKIPATIFLTTAYIGSSTLLWWDRVAKLLARARQERLTSVTTGQRVPSKVRDAVDIFLQRGTKNAVQATLDELKRLGRDARFQTIDAIAEWVGDSSTEATDRVFMTWDEAREMSRAGIDMGSHTQTHPILTELTEPDIDAELRHSKQMIEQETGQAVTLLSYPDGCFSDCVRRIAEEIGYSYAVQTRRDLAVGPNDRYAIPRIKIEESHSLGLNGRFSGSAYAFEVSNLPNLLLLRDARQANPYRSALARRSDSTD
jgi:peptidoglycan/xylan/chitin deacetylase (PgdA/CDA1 family)